MRPKHSITGEARQAATICSPACSLAPVPVAFSLSHCAPCRQRGFTILEVMVTVLILCLGLLGVGGLQYLSIKSNQSAFSRSIATEYANDMLDFIRSNPGMTANSSSCKICKPEAFVYANNTYPTVDAAVYNKIKAWSESINGILPSGAAAICLSSTADLSSLDAGTLKSCGAAPLSKSKGIFYVVTIEWKQAGLDEDQRIVVVGEAL